MRTRVARFVSPALFAAILVAFALPFGTVSCEGPPVQFTGYELATRTVPQTTPPATTDDGESLPDAIEDEAGGWALIALVAAALGAALGFARRRGGGFAASAGLIAVAGLFWSSFDVLGGPEVEYELGYVATAVLFALAAVWHSALAIRRGLGRRRTSHYPPVRLPGH
jgi:hypothetical protein